jgi:glutaredoxin
MKNLEWEEIRVDQSPEKQAEAIKLSGSSTVPVTVIEKLDGLKDVIVGFKPGQLAEAVA